MKTYRVTWEVDVEAETPQEAAKLAAQTYFQDRIANGEAETSCVFEVEPLNENAGPFEVDLAKLKGEGA